MSQITVTVPPVTVYGGTVPDRSAGQTEEQFALNVYPYLGYFNTTFTPENQAVITALNTFKTQANTLADGTNADAVATAADRVQTGLDRVQTGLDVTASAASAASAAAIAGAFVGTSTTSVLIATGSKSFTTQTGEQYTAGIFLTAVSQANTANYMFGQVTSYNSGTGALVLDVQVIGGSGTYADWNLSLVGARGEQGPAGATFNGGAITTLLYAQAGITTTNLVASGHIDTARATVASHATTADIWGALGNQIDWTGTATTTAFPNAPQAGAERTLICAGACSFTAGANMLIDGVTSGNTVTCAANDTVIVRAISTTQFKLTRLKYDGTAQVVAPVTGAGSLIYLSTVTASAASTVTFEAEFTSTYDDYVIFFDGVYFSGFYELFARIKIGGSYITTATYYYHIDISNYSAATYVGIGGNGIDHLRVLSPNAQLTAILPMSGTFNLFDVNNATSVNSFIWNTADTAGRRKNEASGMSTDAGVLQGIQFYPNAGTVTGTFRIYGIKKA